MSAIGPSLPPHLLAKRKRQQEAETNDETPKTPGAKHEASPETAEKRRRVIGPAMPPAPLEELPTNQATADASDSDDEDDLGPALPTDDHETHHKPTDDDEYEQNAQAAPVPEKLQRDEWMTMAPQQDDLAARMDPTKIRARGFNTGKGARGSGGANEASAASAWNETAEQRKKRLADEVLGITSTAGPPAGQQQTKNKAERDEKAAQKLREKTENARGPSMLERHRQDKPEKVDDDPSKRAFDREKDMGHGSRISGTQKREMINKASGYSSRFSKGSYL